MAHASRGAAIMLFRAFICVWVALGTCGLVQAAENPTTNGPNSKYLQQELSKQQQIKATTSRVGVQLEAIIAEFERNGINGEDVKVLRAIRTVLDKLSEKDMTRVLEFLQQSRAATDPAAATQSATEAYAGQKSI